MVASEVRLYREGLQRVLQGIAGIALVGIASCAEEVIAQAYALVPTVILLDLAMARSASRHISRMRLNGGLVVLGIPEGASDALASLPPGILGYVTRDGTVADLLDAIRSAGRGEVYCSRKLAPLVYQRIAVNGAPRPRNLCIDDLTTREMEILKLMQQGLSNKTISRQLGIGLSTVKNHVHSVLAKLGVHCRSEAISLLYRHEHSTRQWADERVERSGVSLSPDEQPAVA